MIRYLSAAGLTACALAGSAQARPVVDIATGECIVSEEPREVPKLLAALPGTGEEAVALRNLADTFEACNGGTKTLSADSIDASVAYMLRADLAEAELRTGKASRMPAPSGASLWFTTGVSSAVQARYAFGVCLVAADPAATTQLVRAYPGTAEEKAAIRALRGKVAGCLKQGARLSLTPADLRQMLAEPLYHNVVAARQ